MKRIFASILLVLAFLLTACSSSSTGMEFLSTLAWSEPRAATEEICKYKFTRYAGDKTGTVLTTEDSFLTYTLKEGKSLKLNSDGTPQEVSGAEYADCTLLISVFSVTYLDITASPVLLRGKTETIETWTVFDRYSMAAKFTYTKADIVEAKGTLAYTMRVDYSGKFLNKRVAKITYSNGKTVTSKIKAGTYYDNQTFYYVVRTLNSLKTGGGQAFKLSLPYEELLNKHKTLKIRNVKHATAADKKNIAVTESVYGLFYSTAAADEDEVKIPCLQTKLGLDEKKNGHALNMYYSTLPTLTNSFKNLAFGAKNVLIAFDYPTYVETSSGVILGYTQGYQLVEYSNGSNSGL